MRQGFLGAPPGWYPKRTGESLILVGVMGMVFFSLPGPDRSWWIVGLSVVVTFVGYRILRNAMRKYGWGGL